MTIPGWVPAWLLTRTAAYAIGVFVLVGGIGIAWNEHNNKVAALALAKEHDKLYEAELVRKDSVLAITRDSLKQAMVRTDVVTKPAVVTVTRYVEQRALVHPEQPQPSSLPVGMVPVSRAYIQEADSAVDALRALILASAQERAACLEALKAHKDSEALKDAEIESLKTIAKNSRPGIGSHLRDFGIGALVGVLGFVLVKNRN